LLEALKHCQIEPKPAPEDVAFEQFRRVIGDEAFARRFYMPQTIYSFDPEAAKAEIGGREAWAKYLEQHKSNPSIYPITVLELERFLEFRRSERAQQRQRERETGKKRLTTKSRSRPGDKGQRRRRQGAKPPAT
jgi:hypothetical protein